MANLDKLQALIQEKYLHKGEFVLSSGAHSTKYFDIKSLLGNKNDVEVLLNAIDDALFGEPSDQIVPYEWESLAGTELGGAILVGAIIGGVENFDNACYIRKGPRVYGLKKMLEGNPISPVLVVDDVCSTTKTFQDAITTLATAECGPYYIFGFFSIINRSEIKSIGGMPMYWLFKEDDFD